MLYSVTGEIVHTDETSVAINCNGVAFLCMTTATTLRHISGETKPITLFTYLNVREDAMDLFGFFDKNELECFKLLISVSGVGPKAALAILSQLTPNKLSLAIATGDVKAITAAQGVGPKIAQRVVLELKNKMTTGAYIDSNDVQLEAVAAVQTSSNMSEALNALVALGFTRSEATVMAAKASPDMSVEDIIKQALKQG